MISAYQKDLDRLLCMHVYIYRSKRSIKFISLSYKWMFADIALLIIINYDSVLRSVEMGRPSEAYYSGDNCNCFI